MKQKTKIILGSPGTGKTTTLLKEVDKALSSGVDPERIAYLSFTKKASQEAIYRAVEKFNIDKRSFKYFRTIHSLAYMLLGINSGQVMAQKDYAIVAKKLGLDVNMSRSMNSEQEYKHTAGDKCLRVYSLHRATKKPLEDIFNELDGEYNDECTLGVVKAFIKTLEAFKNQFNLLDFSDFIDTCHEKIDVDLFIVDEAQDLTRQQWDFIFRVVGEDCKQIIIAGDDDQAIYSWSGANVDDFIAVEGERIILPKTYRLPILIWDAANRVIQNIENRIPKVWNPVKEEKGKIDSVTDISHVNLENGEEWLLLARTNYFLYAYVTHCREQGIIYSMYGKWSNQTPEIKAVLFYENMRKGKPISYEQLKQVMKFVKNAPKIIRKGGGYKYNDIDWPWDGLPDWRKVINISAREKDYISALRSKRNSLIKSGKVKISTIHGVKGGECDNVVISLRVGNKIKEAMRTCRRYRDDEIRVFYVGMTRAKQNLYFWGDESFLYEL